MGRLGVTQHKGNALIAIKGASIRLHEAANMRRFPNRSSWTVIRGATQSLCHTFSLRVGADSLQEAQSVLPKKAETFPVHYLETDPDFSAKYLAYCSADSACVGKPF
jgi:hypothetical protein